MPDLAAGDAIEATLPRPTTSAATRSRAKVTLLALLAATVMMALGFWLRWPIVTYDGPQDIRFFNRYELAERSYSDIATIFYRYRLYNFPTPYLDYAVDYPAGIVLLVWVMNLITTMPEYFLATSVFLLLCGLAVTAMVPQFSGSRVFLWALAPSLPLYVNLNWDLWGILFMVPALLLFVNKQTFPAALLLGIGTWTKLFPVLLLPFFLLDRARKKQWRDVITIAVTFAVVSIVMNLPGLLLRQTRWVRFFRYNEARPREANLWMFFDGLHLSTDDINRLSAVLLVLGFGALAYLFWRRPNALLPVCCAAMCWFFFVNKNYSPQYNLWITVMLAIIGISPLLAVVWWATDLFYLAAGQWLFGLDRFAGIDISFLNSPVLAATAVKEAVTLIIIVWCVRQAWRSGGPDAASVERGLPEPVGR
jgi:uncharacterized membrane protein